jgi:hypothetical protein
VISYTQQPNGKRPEEGFETARSLTVALVSLIQRNRVSSRPDDIKKKSRLRSLAGRNSSNSRTYLRTAIRERERESILPLVVRFMYEEAPDDIGGERCNNCRHAPLQSKNADDMRFCRNLLESSSIKFGSCHERRRRFEKKFINNQN